MGTESQTPAPPMRKAGHGWMLWIPNIAKHRQENPRILQANQASWNIEVPAQRVTLS